MISCFKISYQFIPLDFYHANEIILLLDYTIVRFTLTYTTTQSPSNSGVKLLCEAHLIVVNLWLILTNTNTNKVLKNALVLSLSFSMIISLRYIGIPMHFGRSSCAFWLWHLQIAWQGRMCGNLPDIFSCPSKTDLFVDGIWFVWKQNRISWVTRWGRCVCRSHRAGVGLKVQDSSAQPTGKSPSLLLRSDVKPKMWTFPGTRI